MEARAPRPVIRASEALWARAQDVIPAGTQTLSKGPTQFVRGFAPKYLVRGQGSHVWDADGNEYIDYPMGLGPVTLGHAHPEVNAAITAQLARGNCFSLMHPLEVELAERIRRLVPCAEQVRFGKNGSDATAACVRAARAKTGRAHILRCGYHGWQDWSIDASYGVRAKGVPAEVMALTTSFPYNDLPALERLLESRPVAAVILEPVAVQAPQPGYLAGVRDLATRYGAVLVFDEVITGFRYARGGAQEYFGVTPDLAAMGKGVANGQPLSIVCGRRAFMAAFDEVFFSFTFGGEATALAAAMATLDVMEREDYWAHVWRQGAKLQDGYRALAAEHRLPHLTDCEGLPPWTIVTFKDAAPWSALQLKTLFQQEMLRRGVLFSGSQFICLAHGDEDIARTLDAYRESMRVLRFALDHQAVDALRQGQVNEAVFRRA
jgi:glutamate-1-semialdehyde aminotransferase